MNPTCVSVSLWLILLQGCTGPMESHRLLLSANPDNRHEWVAAGPRLPRPRLKPPESKPSSPPKPEASTTPGASPTAPQHSKSSEKAPCAQQPCTPKRPGMGTGGNGTASDFGSLHGMSRADADAYLRSLGAEVKTTQGGYTHYRFPDKSEVAIRPDGEIIRIPKPQYGADGARINKGARLDEKGAPTQSHNTGERVVD